MKRNLNERLTSISENNDHIFNRLFRMKLSSCDFPAAILIVYLKPKYFIYQFSLFSKEIQFLFTSSEKLMKNYSIEYNIIRLLFIAN